jgi:hypothetical protein
LVSTILKLWAIPRVKFDHEVMEVSIIWMKEVTTSILGSTMNTKPSNAQAYKKNSCGSP